MENSTKHLTPPLLDFLTKYYLCATKQNMYDTRCLTFARWLSKELLIRFLPFLFLSFLGPSLIMSRTYIYYYTPVTNNILRKMPAISLLGSGGLLHLSLSSLQYSWSRLLLWWDISALVQSTSLSCRSSPCLTLWSAWPAWWSTCTWA